MRIRRLFFAAAVTLLLAGCGKDTDGEGITPTPAESEDKELENNGDSEKENTEPTETPTPEPTAEPVKAAENFLELYKDDFYMGIALNPSDFNNGRSRMPYCARRKARMGWRMDLPTKILLLIFRAAMRQFCTPWKMILRSVSIRLYGTHRHRAGSLLRIIQMKVNM